MSANDVFKARWNTRVYWGIIAAAGLHALVFLWSPSWDRGVPEPGSETNGAGIEVVALDEGGRAAPGGGEGVPPRTIVVRDDSGAGADETEPGEGPGISDWELAGPSVALRAELRRRTSPRPALAEPELEADEELRRVAEDQAGAEDGDGDGVRVGGAHALSDYEALSEDERLALENLSALRPELAFISPAQWLLIRNPTEVGEFLKRRFAPGAAGDASSGSLSVAIWVNDRGSVEWAEIKDSSGRQDVDDWALELFQEVASFRPAREGGVPVPIAVIFWVSYPH